MLQHAGVTKECSVVYVICAFVWFYKWRIWTTTSGGSFWRQNFVKGGSLTQL